MLFALIPVMQWNVKEEDGSFYCLTAMSLGLLLSLSLVVVCTGWWMQVSALQLQCHRHTGRLAADAPWATNTLPRGTACNQWHTLHHDIIYRSINVIPFVIVAFIYLRA